MLEGVSLFLNIDNVSLSRQFLRVMARLSEVPLDLLTTARRREVPLDLLTTARRRGST